MSREYAVGSLARAKRARSTGTTVYIERTGEGSPIDQAVGWATICGRHSGFVIHGTLTLARQWASHPEQWCDGCRYRSPDGK